MLLSASIFANFYALYSLLRSDWVTQEVSPLFIQPTTNVSSVQNELLHLRHLVVMYRQCPSYEDAASVITCDCSCWCGRSNQQSLSEDI